MNEIFVLTLAVLIFLIFRWAFRNLPDERWQIIACIPNVKIAGVHWHGINLTYYGFITATAQVTAIAILLILTGSAGIPLEGSLTLIAGLLLICMPASGIMAGLIEKKKHTLTVGGAFFAGLIVPSDPHLDGESHHRSVPKHHDPHPPVHGGRHGAYAFGEGIGRLACISFGCCYGKPLEECGPFIRKLFAHWNFVFSGTTKKIAYAGNMEGRQVIPVQGLSAVVNTAAGLAGVELFLTGHSGAAFLTAGIVSQRGAYFRRPCAVIIAVREGFLHISGWD